MASIVELKGKKGKVSYRVHIKRHSKFLKATGQNATITRTFPTKAEAEFFAESQEREMLRKASKADQIQKIMDTPRDRFDGDRRAEVDRLLQEINHPEPQEVYTKFSHLVKRYGAEIMPTKALNTQRTQRFQLEYWDKRLGHLFFKEITSARINEEKLVLVDKGYKSSS